MVWLFYSATEHLIPKYFLATIFRPTSDSFVNLEERIISNESMEIRTR